MPGLVLTPGRRSWPTVQTNQWHPGNSLLAGLVLLKGCEMCPSHAVDKQPRAPRLPQPTSTLPDAASDTWREPAAGG